MNDNEQTRYFHQLPEWDGTSSTSTISQNGRIVRTRRLMIADAEKLYPLCPTQPEAGSVTESDDGSLMWSPATAHS